jgi:hypothetical protein
VARDQTGKFKLAGLVKRPDYLTCFAGWHMRHVGFGVLHVGKLEHQRGMLFVFLFGADHKLMQYCAGIFDDELDGLALLDGDFLGAKTHGVQHADLDSAFDLFGIACNAPVFLLFFHRMCRFAMGLIAVGYGG